MPPAHPLVHFVLRDIRSSVHSRATPPETSSEVLSHAAAITCPKTREDNATSRYLCQATLVAFCAGPCRQLPLVGEPGAAAGKLSPDVWRVPRERDRPLQDPGLAGCDCNTLKRVKSVTIRITSWPHLEHLDLKGGEKCRTEIGAWSPPQSDFESSKALECSVSILLPACF